MNNQAQHMRSKFDESYFSSGAYADVGYHRFSQYWWSNRYYAILVRKHGPRTGRVFELGCGLGHLLAWLVDRYQVYGADINHWALTQASRNVPEGNFLCLSAEDLGALPSDFFQIVIAKHVLEHLHHPDQAIAEMSRILGPGGVLLMATPNTESLARPVKKESWIGYKDKTHVSLWPPEKWMGELKRYQFRPRKIFSDGLWDAPYVSWLPAGLQKVIFGAPGGLQAMLGLSFVPLRLGESLIILADKK